MVLKVHLFFVFWILVFSFSGNAQLIYQKAISNDDERVNDIVQLNDSTYYFSGAWRNCSNCPYSSLLGKADSHFNIFWSYQYSDSSIARNLFITNDGIVFFGSDLSASESKHILSKTDFDGNLIWSNSYGYNYGNSGTITPQFGGYLICGSAYVLDSIGNDSTLLNLISVDSSGTMVWTKSYFIGDYLSVSGAVQLADSNFIISCRYLNNLTNHFESVILRLNNIGEIIWAQNYSIAGKNLLFSTNLIFENNKIYQGAAIINNPLTFPLVVVLDDTGGVLLSTSYFQIQGGSAPTYLLKNTINKRLLITFGQGLLVSDSLTNFIEAHTYVPNFPANSYYYKCLQTADNGILMGGFNTGANDIFIVKTDSFYNGGCGYFDVVFTNNPEIISNYSFLPQEVTIPISIIPRQIINNTISFTENTYCLTATSLLEVNNDNKFEIFPNPVIGELYIKNVNVKGIDKYLLTIFNVNGVKVFQKELNNLDESINIEYLSPGVFILNLYLNNCVIHKKIVKL